MRGPMLAAEEAGTEVSTGDYLSQWLRHSKARLRSKTHEGYEGVIRLYACPRIGQVALGSLHPLHLQQLYSDLIDRGLGGGTVRNLHLVLAQALSQAVRWGLIERSPAAGAQPPRPRRPEPVVVDHALAARILAAVSGTRMELPAAVALGTGMRRGEILALRWSDLDPGYTAAQVRRSLQVSGQGMAFVEPKTRRSRRQVALPSFLGPHLERQKKDQEVRQAACPAWLDTDLVIDAGEGRPRHPDTLSSGWYRFLKSSGLPHVRFHDLRHAHATLLLLSRVHPKVVSERLGHASVGITLDTYSHVLPSMQTEAAAAIDALFGPAVTALSPMLLASARELPSGQGWAFEPTWDGFRCLAHLGEDTRLLSRRGKDLSPLLPELSGLHRSPCRWSWTPSWWRWPRAGRASRPYVGECSAAQAAPKPR